MKQEMGSGLGGFAGCGRQQHERPGNHYFRMGCRIMQTAGANDRGRPPPVLHLKACGLVRKKPTLHVPKHSCPCRNFRHPLYRPLLRLYRRKQAATPVKIHIDAKAANEKHMSALAQLMAMAVAGTSKWA